MTLVYAGLIAFGVTTLELLFVVALVPRFVAALIPRMMELMLKPPSTKPTGPGPVGGMTTTTNNLS